MIRILSATAVAATFGLALSACQPGGSVGSAERTAGIAPGEPVPEIYDWRFLTHETSGELNFGDEDFAEGISLFHLRCTPRSRIVEVSWGYPGEAVLTSGTATGTFRADEKTQSDHPVFTALKDNGVLAVGLSGADMTLKTKAPGRAQLAAFFDYCNRGPEIAPQPTPPVVDVPSDEALATEVVPGSETTPVDHAAEPAATEPAEAPVT